YWQKSARLVRAIHQVGLGGCSFRLVGVEVTRKARFQPLDLPAGSLILTFSPEGAAPPGKEREAGLALRCFVGLTLPQAVGGSRELQISMFNILYTVLLGEGVPLKPYFLFHGGDRVGPLAMRSTEGDGL